MTPGLMKELRVKVSVRNNRLVRAREELGLNQRATAEAMGITGSQLSALETMLVSPYDPRGELTTVAQRVADYYGHAPEWLWPDVTLAVRRSMVEVEVSAAEASAMLARGDQRTPLALVADAEAINLALDQLSDRERAVIERRYGLAGEDPGTLTEAGERVGVGPERARQIEARAMHLMRERLEKRTR